MPRCVRATLVQASESPLLTPRVPLTNPPATVQRAYPTSQQGHLVIYPQRKEARVPPDMYTNVPSSSGHS